jgi:hypothetical protein
MFEILYQLEKIFSPTFFDIMEHLILHLPTEVRLAGPVQFRNMWYDLLHAHALMTLRKVLDI